MTLEHEEFLSFFQYVDALLCNGYSLAFLLLLTATNTISHDVNNDDNNNNIAVWISSSSLYRISQLLGIYKYVCPVY